MASSTDLLRVAISYVIQATGIDIGYISAKSLHLIIYYKFLPCYHFILQGDKV